MKLKTRVYPIRILSSLLISLVLLVTQFAQAGIPLSKSLDPAKIYGYQPYMNSIGTIMYNVNTVGNPSAVDENGKRVPTEGSIIGFKDLFCVEGGLNDSIPLLASEWQPFFDYADSDLDICNKDTPHTVEWYMIDTPDISVINSWSEIADKATLITSTNYPDAIISPKSTYTFHEGSGIGSDETVTSPISGDVTSALKVPKEAIGKYIGVRYIPLSQTGLPLQGLAVEMWDLNYFYGQTPPATPGEAPQDDADALKTIKKGENNYVGGTGGGKVQPAPERPDIDELTISGIMSPGRTLTLDYQFIPYPQTNPDSRETAGDKSVFVWGASDTSFYASNYDVFKSLKENDIHQADEIRMTQGREVVLELADIGTFVEVSALPIRQEATELFPVPGIAKTYHLADFAENIETLQRPVVSNLMIQGMATVGSKLTASYLYTPSNSQKSYDASTYIWTYDTASVKDNLINEGIVETNPETIPDYTKTVTISTLEGITAIQLGGPAITPEFAGNIFRVKVQATDASGLTGNTAEDDTAPKLGVPNDMFGIKLVAYNYGGSFPVNRPYGSGYPSTGFAGAQFQLFAESFDVKKNEANWTWSVAENPFYAAVDSKGIVTLLRIPPKDSVIRVIATNKTDATQVRSHSFTLNKWLVSFRELSGGAKGYNLNKAAELCNNYKKNVSQVFLPALEDYTSLPADPKNPLMSKGAGTLRPGWDTIYTFPSNDFYSQWGELDVYYAIDLQNGSRINDLSFREFNTPYAWTRSTYGENNSPIFTAPTGWADWFVSNTTAHLLNTACIAYADDFQPEIPPREGPYMKGIKLPFTGYPRNNSGFETAHAYGKGFPSLGFNGAKFILFAEDGPGSFNFINNITTNNTNWEWKISDGAVATSKTPSRNPYAFVTNTGEVVLLASPPIGTVIEITATQGDVVLTHSFSIKKWLYSYQDLGAKLKQTISSATAICTAKDLRIPKVDEYTAMPVDPNNSEQSLGFATLKGWNIIYDFPSTDYYSQWGELDLYYRYDVNTLKLSEGAWYHNDYVTSDFTAKNYPITARVSGWGDWLAFTGNQETGQFYFACIQDREFRYPEVSNIQLSANFGVNNKITATYDFKKGNDDIDKSHYQWLVDSNETLFNGQVSESGILNKEAFEITQEFVGKQISLRITPIDGLDTKGTPDVSKNSVIYDAPKITNVNVLGGNITGITLSADYTFSGSNQIDKTDLIWTSKTQPNGISSRTYMVALSDRYNPVSLKMIPIDGNGIRGDVIDLGQVRNILIETPPDATDLKFIEADEAGNISIGVGLPLTVSYKYVSGASKDPRDASIFWWLVDTNTVIEKTVVPESGKTGSYIIKAEDVGKLIKARIYPTDASGKQGKAVREISTNASTKPQIQDLTISFADTLSLDENLTVSYTFIPGFNTDVAEKSTYIWFRGTTEVVRGQVSTTVGVKPYPLTMNDSGKVIALEIVPKNSSQANNEGTKQRAEIAVPSFPEIITLEISGKRVVAEPLKGIYEFKPASTGPADNSIYRWNKGEWKTVTSSGFAGEHANFTWDNLKEVITLDIIPIGEGNIRGPMSSVNAKVPSPVDLTFNRDGTIPATGDFTGGTIWTSYLDMNASYFEYLNTKYGVNNWDIGHCMYKTKSITPEDCTNYTYLDNTNFKGEIGAETLRATLATYTVPSGYQGYEFVRIAVVRVKSNGYILHSMKDRHVWY